METYLFFYYLHDYQSSHCQLLYFSICQNMKQQHLEIWFLDRRLEKQENNEMSNLKKFKDNATLSVW